MTIPKEHPQLYLVSTFMSQAEIEARSQLDGQEGFTLLVNFTKYSAARYTEEKIGYVIRSAAEELEVEDAEGWDPDDFEYSCLPFRLKVLVLRAAERLWDPGDENCPVLWIGSYAEAEGFFERFPELRDFQTKTAEEIGAAWLARQSAHNEEPGV